MVADILKLFDVFSLDIWELEQTVKFGNKIDFGVGILKILEAGVQHFAKSISHLQMSNIFAWQHNNYDVSCRNFNAKSEFFAFFEKSQ